MKVTPILLFAVLLFSACGKPYEYYYLSDEVFLENFYPYKEGQTVIFENENGNNNTFVVDKVTADVFKTTSECDCVSEASYTYTLRSDSLCLILGAESTSMEREKGLHTFSISLTKTHQDLGAPKSSSPILSYNYYGTWPDCLVTIGEAIPYTENDNSTICHVIHAKDQGITAFTIANGGSKWKLVKK